MQWQENSIILSTKALAENSRIVTVFNKTMGKTSGLVKGLKTSIQPGDISDILWKGRTAEQLGTFKIENIFSPFIYAFNNSAKIFAIESVCFLCFKGLPEKAPHCELFDFLKTLFLSIPQKQWLVNYVIFEINFLSEIGYGLDLSRCAVSGKTDNLFYVSPRTGRAVTKTVGEKYKDQLFILPQFLISKDNSPTDQDIFCGLQITGHFLKMYFNSINNKKLPLSRDYLIAELKEKSEIRL